MSLDTANPRSRRALLAAAVGAAVATVASAVARPGPASATDDQPLLLGQSNATGKITSVVQSVAMAHTFTVSAGPANDAIYALGPVAMVGEGSAIGVKGTSPSGVGIEGSSQTGVGVRGMNVVANSGAVEGQGPVGVAGWGGVSRSLLSGVAGTGVYGSGTSAGVRGESTAGTGVLATTTTGTALQVAGKAKFSRSGRATVLKGKYYTDITVAGGLTSRSVVNATLQTYRAGVAIAAVRLNYPSTGKARIYLTKIASTTSGTYVGWFVAEY